MLALPDFQLIGEEVPHPFRAVSAAAFSPDGRSLALAEAHSIVIRSVDCTTLLRPIKLANTASCLDWRGNRIAAGHPISL